MKRALSIDLRAGEIELRFEPQNLLARAWKARGVQILQGISLTLRDCNWGTPAPEVEWKMLHRDKDSFALDFTARYYRGQKEYFSWQGELAGTSAGEVVFSTRGTARQKVQTNRAGFCILYPAEVAGMRCRIRHTSGKESNSHFPKQISPHQPFFDLRAIAHSPVAGIGTEVEMNGDVFEMEDQRNWTDSSFKVYCRPLVKPYPFLLARHETVEQSIRVRLTGSRSRLRSTRSAGDLVLGPSREKALLPFLGLGYAAEKALPAQAPKYLKMLGLEHIRIELDAKESDWVTKWKNAVKACQGVGCGLDVALFLEKEDAPCLEQNLPAAADFPCTRWFAFSREKRTTTEPVLKAARSALLAQGWKSAQIGGGTDVYFVDLNRLRPFYPDLAFIGYSINPQVHAFDNLSLLETLPMHRLTASETRRLAGGRPVHIGPITFRPRFNPVATTKSVAPKPDPRQTTRFGAVWTLGSIIALAQGRATSATFYSTHGEGSVLSPNLRPTILHRLFRAMRDFSSGKATLLEGKETDTAFGLFFVRSFGWKLLVANASETARTLRLHVPHARKAACQFLHSGKKTALTAAKENFLLEMPGYSVAQLEGGNHL